MKVNNLELARRIHEEYPNYLIKDLVVILEAEQDEVVNALRNHEEVKWGKLYKFNLQEKPAREHYDGLHHKNMQLPDRYVVKEKQLSRIKKLYTNN